MNGCTETGKPQISILMAVYEPRMDWLREQLLSLDAQTYPNLKLYIRDDCSPTVSYEAIQACAQECIRAFPYEIRRNEKNLGSNGTFELLTREAEGEFFAYCDQDDIWLPEKLEKLFAKLTETNSVLICSDVTVVDAEGRKTADSITELRPRHVFLRGEGLAPALIYRNFVIGCTALIQANQAKEALPFAKHMVHDHYLAFYCALHGSIAVYPEALVKYRIHGSNQTGVLNRVTNRSSYIERHMMPFCRRVEELQQRFALAELELAEEWVKAREENAIRKPGSMKKLWRLRHINKPTTMFELIVLRLPGPLLQMALKVIRSGKI